MAAEWIGVTEFKRALAGMVATADAATRGAVASGAAAIETAAKSNFEGHHAKGKPHQGGSLPNVVSGNLRRSIKTDPIQSLGLATYATKVGPTAVYGRAIELGLRQNPAVSYPYFGPAFAAVQPKLAGIFQAAWRTALFS